MGPCIIHYAVVRDWMRLLLKSLMTWQSPEPLSHFVHAKVLLFVRVHLSFCGVAAARLLHRTTVTVSSEFKRREAPHLQSKRTPFARVSVWIPACCKGNVWARRLWVSFPHPWASVRVCYSVLFSVCLCDGYWVCTGLILSLRGVWNHCFQTGWSTGKESKIPVITHTHNDCFNCRGKIMSVVSFDKYLYLAFSKVHFSFDVDWKVWAQIGFL